MLALTLATQVGVVLRPVVGAALGWRGVALGLVVYALASAVVVPPIAAALGRVPLPCASGPLRARSWVYCAANRRYDVQLR